MTDNELREMIEVHLGQAGVLGRIDSILEKNLIRDLVADIKQHTDRAVEPYRELIMAVESNFEGETRHQTALRYIREAERYDGEQDTFKQFQEGK